MTKEELLKKGIVEEIIAFDDNENPKRVTYLLQNKIKNYKTEEIVQVEAYLKLIFEYHYPQENIGVYYPVKMGSDEREADIVVFSDSSKNKPYIVVECKTEDVSNAEYHQSIRQALSYASSLRAKFIWTTSGINNHYYQVSDDYPQQPNEIPDIPKKDGEVKQYKYAKQANGYFDLKEVSEAELTQRFKQAHNALWAGGELDPSAAFDELDKLIFCKLMDEQNCKIGQPYDFQFITIKSHKKQTDTEKTKAYHKAVNELAKRIGKLYNQSRQRDPEVFKEDIRLNPAKIKAVVGYLEEININKTDLDSKGRAFETFMNSFFRGNFGQFFTPRNIVQFMIDVLPISNSPLILDTSCGSGGFLLHALDKVRKQADNYHSPDSNAHYRHWHDFAQHNLFGIEINEQIARVAKMNMIIHDDGHTNIVNCDGLLPVEDVTKQDQDGHNIVVQIGIKNSTNNNNIKFNHFDFIVTNPPFGSTIRQVEQAYSSNYDVFHKEVNWLEPASKRIERANQSTEALFIEQCHQFLKVGGYLAIVVPDSILTNSSLQYVRNWLATHFKIVAIISMPQTAFTHKGAGVKSSLMFLKKYDSSTTNHVKDDILNLQNRIKQQHNFEQALDTLNQEKRQIIKNFAGFNKPANLSDREIKQSDEFKQWSSQITAQYKTKIDHLKEILQSQYDQEINGLLMNYDIFMAVAQNIGYDATGRLTKINELDFIGQELIKFIEQLEHEQ